MTLISDHQVQAREARLRRQLRALDIQLRKSRHDGGYMLVDVFTNGVIAGAENNTAYEYTLDSVEEWLQQSVRIV